MASLTVYLQCYLFVVSISAQNLVLTGSNTVEKSFFANEIPTGSEATYATYSSARTLSIGDSMPSGSVPVSSNIMVVQNQTVGSGSDTSTRSITLLQGSSYANGTNSSNPTGASGSPQAKNTQPCNNYVQFCERRYSNITEVAAHNSPFVVKNNAASNQELGVITQLDDGIRMLQGQTHKVNGTIHYCHTSCDLLNAGTAEAYYAEVAAWVQSHPYDVVTILIGNGDTLDPIEFVDPIQKSGLGAYVFTPPKFPMALDDWPTLSSMILAQNRVVLFMDYKANQSIVPYILDEFSQLWETPFSPTNRAFPCDVQRPPGLDENAAKSRLYMANHNLNTEISVAGASLLVPNTVELNVTNGVDGFGSLGVATASCNSLWGRPPNFLLVDFYNIPSNGSVFEVAAKWNNVTYNRRCCGIVPSQGSKMLHLDPRLIALVFAIFSLFLI